MWRFYRYKSYLNQSMQGLAGGNGNFEDYWQQSSFSYKCCCLSSSIMFALSLLIPGLIILCIDIPNLTIWSFELWRLFVSMYGQIPTVMSILSILFSFMWIYSILKDSEYSTVYKIFELFLINLEIHLVFNVISLLFTLLFDTSNSILFYGYGWFPIIIVYQFRNSVINPEADRRFCCLPFMIKNKYYPWVLLVLLALFSTQFFCFISCGIVGYYQEVVRKDMFIKLPLWFYKKVESILPASIKTRTDFVSIAQVQNMLKTKCYKAAEVREEQHHDNNPYAYNQHQQPQLNVVNAQQIGGGQPVDFRNYWAQKDLVKGTKSNSNPGDIEIEPKNNNYGQPNQINFENQNNSYATFNDDIPHDKKLLGDVEQRLDQDKAKNKNEKKNFEGEGNDLI